MAFPGPPGQSQLDTEDLDEEERKALAEVSKMLGENSQTSEWEGAKTYIYGSYYRIYYGSYYGSYMTILCIDGSYYL